MNSDLKNENASLRQQLEALLLEAQRNQDKMRRFDLLERRLLAASALTELLTLVLTEYQQAFAVEFVTLTLVDREREVERILESTLSRSETPSALKLCDSPLLLDALYGTARQPCLECFDATRHQALFDAPPGAVASVALLPLVRHGQLIGSLHFGSARAERYAGDSGTDFLERLSEVVAICIENALSYERLKQIGLTDALTGVHNRRYFEHRCKIEVSQARRYKRPLACMFLDIDKFKKINDTYGHPAGDEILRNVAQDIQSQLRLGDTIARYGGEEFVVLLPQSEMHHASQIAERARTAIERKLFYSPSGQGIKVTLSIGVSSLPHNDPNRDISHGATQLVEAADQALYRAKNAGRNRVECAETPPGEEPPTQPNRLKRLFRRLSTG